MNSDAPSNLPRPLSSFHGREQELATLAQWAPAPLISIVGPGGMGKTRLALELAHRARASGQLSGGVWYFDVGERSSLEEALHEISATLGVRLVAHSLDESVQELANLLALRGPSLMVVDSAEVFVDELASAIGIWLRGSTNLRVIVGSRQRLGVGGERVLRLTPLPRQAALELFLDRLEHYVVIGSRDQLAQDVVGELEAFPLAIELAAANARWLPPSKLKERIRTAPGSLRSDRRDGPARHLSMSAAIEWSWQLLSDELRRALTELTVFRGGFELHTAEKLLSSGQQRAAEILRALIARSLLRRDEQGRLRLYQAVHELTRDRGRELVSWETLEKRHAEVILDEVASCIEPAPSWESLIALRLELANLQAIVERCAATWPRLAARACLAAERVLSQDGPFSLRLRICKQAVELADESGDDALRARSRISRAAVTLRDGTRSYALIREDLDLARSLAVRAQAHESHHDALGELGNLEWFDGNLDSARALWEEALELAEANEMTRRVMMDLYNLGLAARDSGQMTHARALLQASVKVAEKVAPGAATLGALSLLSRLAADRAEKDEAAHYCQRALEMAQRFADRRWLPWVLELSSALALDRGQLSEARSTAREALRLAQEGGVPYLEAAASLLEGYSAHADGDLVQARLSIERAVSLNAHGPQHRQSIALLAQAIVEADSDPDLAAESLSQARALIAASSNPTERNVLDLAEAFVASLALPPDARSETRSELERLAAEAEANQHAHLRRLCGLARREIARLDPPSATVELVVAQRGDWFQLAGQPKAELARRPHLRRIVVALAEQSSTSVGLTTEELFQIGWPDERADPKSSSQRVRTALSTLRRMGLRPAIVRDTEGCRLAPGVVVRRAKG